ncbi:anthrone oxygenase family protein [Demequina activiva]|uniref:Membrane protein n=1 Tax=Demequina activiva TaxID=1582364 RepID=A0A919UKM5_9MICO|nr:anthrone oxygenase family protein [Demequina activiva]GIG53848.1 membrane protein [Demequina activiva]
MSAYQALVVAAIVVTGMAAGVLYAFSAFVMAGISEQPASAAAATMQAINRHAQRWRLGLLLLATLAVPAATALAAVVGVEPGRGWAVAGAAVTVAGVLGVTAVGNVPLNERLARAAEPVEMWGRFVRPWLAWNHLRTAAGALACGLFAIALHASGG